MPKYNLCIIDDKIPAQKFSDKIEVDDTGLIEQNVLFNYLRFGETDAWDDSDIYNLVKCLKEEKAEYFTFSAFTNHEFYLKYIDENIYSPDIIIFDWDVEIPASDPSKSLKEILERTYCLVAIYTGTDKRDEVTQILKGDAFKSYDHRLFLIKKEGEDSVNELLSKIEEHFKYFAFSYGFKFRKRVNDAINLTFSTIGKLSFEQFITIFGEPAADDEAKCQIDDIDFIEIMSEQIKANLLALSTNELVTVKKTQPSDIIAEKLMWHLRMMHSPKDSIVRKGDIVFHNADKRYYLIISSDCHLNRFWSKNIGYLTMIPLYKCDDQELSVKLKNHINKKSFKSFNISALTNPQSIPSITLIPYLDQKSDYILVPKEVKSMYIEQQTKHERLLYKDIPDFKADERYRLNEPFLSALIEFVIKCITDVGTPDYSENVKNNLGEAIKKLGRDK